MIKYCHCRSDDTGRSEIESRGEPEGGEDTPPPVNPSKYLNYFNDFF